jgi:hypothetical protein
MNEIMKTHLSLEKLVFEAQNTLPQTKARQQALEKLFRRLMQEISGAYQYKMAFGNQDILEEAMQSLWLYICEKIDNYNSSQGTVMAWVNNLLKWRTLDQKQALYQTIGQTILIEPEHLTYEEQPLSLTETLHQIIEQDQDQLFSTHHLSNHAHLSFKQLAILRLSGTSWGEIAHQYQVSEVNLRKFWSRSVKRFAPILKQSLQE